MGDCFQFVAETEVTESDAPAKGTELLKWLIREGIVLAEPNHEYVHSKAPGYAPGPRYADACESPDIRMDRDQARRTNYPIGS